MSITLTRRPVLFATLLLLAGLLVTLAAPIRSPGGGLTAATTTLHNCTGTWFFDSSSAGTEFEEGDTWQGGTFTDIEMDNIVLVRLDNGHLVGRFPMGFVNGDEATIDFGTDILITAILWHDNDPNPGETGWSFNGIAGPITGDGNTLVTLVNLTTDSVNIKAGGDSGGIDFCFTPVDGGGGEGCTPGYWKVPQHHDSWVATGFTTGQTVESVFDVPDSLGMDNVTLLQALQGGGGPGVTGGAKILLRAATASLLNASHPDVSFGQTTSEVISSVNAALASLDRGTMLALAGDLDDANNQGCPLN
ncbi:MAG: hypothetical protein ACRDG7_13465 [Candidatus Limnocylindria bacterium]